MHRCADWLQLFSEATGLFLQQRKATLRMHERETGLWLQSRETPLRLL